MQIVWAAVGHSSFIFSEYFDRFWVFECLRYRKVMEGLYIYINTYLACRDILYTLIDS